MVWVVRDKYILKKLTIITLFGMITRVGLTAPVNSNAGQSQTKCNIRSAASTIIIETATIAPKIMATIDMLMEIKDLVSLLFA